MKIFQIERNLLHFYLFQIVCFSFGLNVTKIYYYYYYQSI